jgi:hypothetical protein
MSLLSAEFVFAGAVIFCDLSKNSDWCPLAVQAVVVTKTKDKGPWSKGVFQRPFREGCAGPWSKRTQ